MRLKFSPVLTVAFAACAHTAQVTPSAVSPQASTSAAPGAAVVVEWTGKLRPVRISGSSGTLGSSGSDAILISGDVRLTRVNDQITRVEITASDKSGLNGEFTWALIPGDCRSGDMPLMPLANFPAIRFAGGTAAVDREIPLQLPVDGNLHVNVYSGGEGEADVVSCAHLSVQRRN